MARAAIFRSFLVSNKEFSSSLSFPFFRKASHLFCASRFHSYLPTVSAGSPLPRRTLPSPSLSLLANRHFQRRLLSSSESEATGTRRRSRISSAAAKTNFVLSETESESESENEESEATQKQKPKEIDKSKLPPPYDPFSKKPAIEEPKDPKNLQEIFHNMKTEGLMSNAVKMFDALSKDGRTHEALELFSQIKDKGHMPDVVAHTAVVEAYANAGKGKEALKVFLRMLAAGVEPNTYTYRVLIRGLAAEGKLEDAKRYTVEMMGKGMWLDAATCAAVLEAFVREQKLEEGRDLVGHIKAKRFLPKEEDLREVLKGKRGPVFRSVMSLLSGE